MAEKSIVPVLPPLSELPEAMQTLRNDRERVFVWAYMFNGGNGAAAARSAGYSDTKEGAKVRAHHLLLRTDVQAAQREMCAKYFFALAPKAIFRLGQLLDDRKHKQHAKAIEMTLSRTGFGERSTIAVEHTHVVVDHDKAAVADLRRLKSLGVPRLELERMFGFSGLPRYEKMLELEDRSADAEARIIDGEVVARG